MMPSAGPLPFRRVGIIGLGPLGGSLARALRALAAPPEVLASSDDARELERAVAQGAVQRPSTPERIASTADLVVYATPAEMTAVFLEAHAPRWREQALVTDLSPIKRALAQRGRELGLGARYVPSHALVAEAGAATAARADLFAGARVWVTPLEEAGEPAAQQVDAFWRVVGAQPLRTDPEKHDRVVAWTAQLPQLAATALAAALSACAYPPRALGVGARAAVAESAASADAWERALLANADLLEDPLMALEGTVGVLAEAVRARDPAALRAIFERAARWREG